MIKIELPQKFSAKRNPASQPTVIFILKLLGRGVRAISEMDVASSTVGKYQIENYNKIHKKLSGKESTFQLPQT